MSRDAQVALSGLLKNALEADMIAAPPRSAMIVEPEAERRMTWGRDLLSPVVAPDPAGAAADVGA